MLYIAARGWVVVAALTAREKKENSWELKAQLRKSTYYNNCYTNQTSLFTSYTGHVMSPFSSSTRGLVVVLQGGDVDIDDSQKRWSIHAS